MGSGLLGADGLPIREAYGDGFALPHVMTFASIIGSARTYYHHRWDEAFRHSREDALAMKRDATLMGPLNERMKSVSSLNWHLAVPDEKDPLQAAVRDELTQIIKGIRGLRRIVKALLWSIWYGRYGVQVKWQWGRHRGRRVLTVEKWQPVNGDKIGHTFAGIPYILAHATAAKDLAGAETVRTTYANAVLLKGGWRDRFIIHCHDIEDADYLDAEQGEKVHGVGLRDQLFWLNWIRLDWLAKVADYMERVGLGVNLWYFEAGNKASMAEVRQLAEDQSGRANILIPRGAEGKNHGPGMERLETPTSGADLLIRLQEYVEQRMERLIVGQSLSSKSEGGGMGGTGVADLHAATKHKITASDAADLAETLTGSDDEPGIVNTIHRWTFPETYPGRNNPNGFPVWWVFDVEQAESKEKLEAIAKAVSIGVRIKQDEVRAAAGLSKPDDGDETVGSEQPMTPGMEGEPGSRREGASAPQGVGVRTFGRGQPRRFGHWVNADGKMVRGRPKDKTLSGGRWIEDDTLSTNPAVHSKTPNELRKTWAGLARLLPTRKERMAVFKSDKAKKQAERNIEHFTQGLLGSGWQLRGGSNSADVVTDKPFTLDSGAEADYHLDVKLIGTQKGSVRRRKDSKYNKTLEAADQQRQTGRTAITAFLVFHDHADGKGVYLKFGDDGDFSAGTAQSQWFQKLKSVGDMDELHDPTKRKAFRAEILKKMTALDLGQYQAKSEAETKKDATDAADIAVELAKAGGMTVEQLIAHIEAKK